jgi:formimidoylglutamate deiminase
MIAEPSLFAETALLPTGWTENVRLTFGPGGVIASVETGASMQSGDARLGTRMLLPAPANVHSHTFQRAMAGLTEGRGPDPKDSFWTWRRLMYRFLNVLTPEQIEDIAALAFMEMLEAGYASVAEFHYLHHGANGVPYDNLAELTARIAAAAQKTGIGLTLLPVLYSQGGCDGRPLQGGQLRFANDWNRFAKLFDATQSILKNMPADTVIGMAPHSLRAVDARDLPSAIALADGAPVHMHIAEQVAEVEEVQAFHGARPVEWLLENQPVDRRWCLIHCTHLSASETAGLARSGAVAGLCPITESNLGDGIFDAVKYLSAAGRMAFGTDSNVQISLFDELKTLEYSQRLRDRGRSVLAAPERSTGRTLLDSACQNGGRAIGRKSGSIETGMFADLMAVETDNRWFAAAGGDQRIDTLIFAGVPRECVSDVWSAGRHVVSGGRHRNADDIAARYKRTVSTLKNLI